MAAGRHEPTIVKILALFDDHGKSKEKHKQAWRWTVETTVAHDSARVLCQNADKLGRAKSKQIVPV